MRLRAALCAMALALLSPGALACVPKTGLQQTWRAPEWNTAFAHVVIFGVAPQAETRRNLERQMAGAFNNVGVRATPAYTLFNRDVEPSRAEIAAALEDHDIDGLMITRLVVEGVPPETGEPRPGFYDDYHALYLAEDGELGSATAAFETTLYTTDEGQPVWSGLSDGFDVQGLDEAIETVAQRTVDALLEGDRVRRTVTPGAIETYD